MQFLKNNKMIKNITSIFFNFNQKLWPFWTTKVLMLLFLLDILCCWWWFSQDMSFANEQFHDKMYEILLKKVILMFVFWYLHENLN